MIFSGLNCYKTPIHRGPHGTLVGCLAGPRVTTLVQPAGRPPATTARNPMIPMDLLNGFLLNFVMNTSHQLKTPPNFFRIESITTRKSKRTLDESLSCLARVDIEPPKLNLKWKGFSQNPNENVGHKST
jgi:hypothetical protein